MEAKEFAKQMGKFLSEKKAEDVVLINVREKTIVADYYVLATGRSMTHVRSLCDLVEEEFGKQDVVPLRREGVREGRWAVLDYGDVVLHIFNDESRLFYHLERLWGDGENTEKIL